MSAITLDNTTNTMTSPTPEPSTALLIAPLLVLGFFGRRYMTRRNATNVA